mgnify:CR=1 FL=1|tara:strand:+ start:172 stop:468 length:297 start_codon:yes stop_codon:yes gene_type:complete
MKLTSKLLKKLIKEQMDEYMGSETCEQLESEARTASMIMADMQEMSMLATNRGEFESDYDLEGRMEDQMRRYQEAKRKAKELGCEWASSPMYEGKKNA